MRRRIPTLAVLAVLACIPPVAAPQVVTDGSVGARATISGRNLAIPGSLGLQFGGNLLHSFSEFNVRRGESATFSGIPTIQRIIARVTGGAASEVNGALRVTIPGASLYLVNPSGIVFGDGASLSVPGSFYASTAHYLKLEDGTRVAMSATPDVTLTAAPISRFGFESAAAPIYFSGTQLRTGDTRRLGIVGGGLSLAAGPGGRVTSLQALSGSIALVATASAGEAIVEGDTIRPEGFGAMGAIVIRDNALVSVNEDSARRGGGAIYIRGGNVEIDHSTVRANTRFANARGIDIGASDGLVVRNSGVVTVTTGAGNAGRLRLAANNMTISEESLVDTSCDPGCTTGLGGRLELSATGTLRIEGTDPIIPTYVVSNSFGGGRTGDIDVTAGSLVIDGNAYLQGIATANSDSSSLRVRAGNIVLRNGGQIDGGVHGTGKGGIVDVAATGSIVIEGLRQNVNPNPKPDEPAFFPSGIFSNTLRTGNAGDIVVSTRTLDILAGGEVSSSAGRLGITSTGVGGSVTVNASERITVSGYGTSPAIDASGIFANTFGAGEGGRVALSSPLIQVLNEGRVQTQSEGGGRSGSIGITGRDVLVASRGQIASSGFGPGGGGTVTIDLDGTLTVTGAGSGIFATTAGEGPGGSIDIDAARVVIEDFGAISTQTRSTSPNAGRGGTIAVHARETIALTGGANITAGSFSTGDGGNVAVRSDGRLEMSGNARITTTTEQPGDAGTVQVTAGDSIAMSGGAAISSESLSTGLAGRVDVVSGGLLEIRSGARITTAARSSDGGDIAVTADAAVLDSGRITTEVGTGLGGGGNMEIQVPTLILRNSLITANAFGGPGGNIHIATKTFIPSADSAVTASSQLGVDGTITIESPALDPTGELLVPAPSYFDAGSVLAGRCGPRLAGRASSLVVEPRRLADVAPDALRSMLDLLAAPQETSCCPATVASF